MPLRFLYPLLMVVAAYCLVSEACGQAYVLTSTDIQEYDAATGALINNSVVSNNWSPQCFALEGSNFYVTSTYNPARGTGAIDGSIEKYTISGTPVGYPLLHGLTDPFSLTISGGNLYVLSLTSNNARIGKYDAATGAAINASLVTLSRDAQYIAVSGNSLFVTNFSAGTIAQYNATTGAAMNASFIMGLSNPEGIVVSGSNIFVANRGNGTIGEYTISGATVNASLITGLDRPVELAIDGNNLFEINDGLSGAPTVGEYTLSGATINASLLTATAGARGIAVIGSVPEPSAMVLIVLAVGFGVCVWKYRFCARGTRVGFR